MYKLCKCQIVYYILENKHKENKKTKIFNLKIEMVFLFRTKIEVRPASNIELFIRYKLIAYSNKFSVQLQNSRVTDVETYNL